jgi:hypothetical protein
MILNIMANLHKQSLLQIEILGDECEVMSTLARVSPILAEEGLPGSIEVISSCSNN